jgi:multimeric flavodoxin WrbA
MKWPFNGDDQAEARTGGAPVRALFLNCSLKGSADEPSHTQALWDSAAKALEAHGAAADSVRLADLVLAHSVSPQSPPGDMWPDLHQSILDHHILVVGTPLWLGEKSSIAAKLVERLYAMSGETDAAGRPLYYGRTAGVLVTGNEDGAKAASRSLLYALQHVGFAVPPHADAYWVGEAGPGPSYRDAGRDNAFTQRSVRRMASNLVHFARMMADAPIPAPRESTPATAS